MVRCEVIVDAILEAMTAEAGERKRSNRLGSNNIGKCVRSLWYTTHNYKPEPMQGRASATFMLGDLVESAVIGQLKKTKVPHIHMARMESTDPAEYGFRPILNEPNGSKASPRLWGVFTKLREDWRCLRLPELDSSVVPDVIFEKEIESRMELVVVDVKSMANYPFERAERGDVDEQYLCQLETQMRAVTASLGVDCRYGLVLAYRKETSHLHEVVIQRDDERYAKIKVAAWTAKAGAVPPRPYKLQSECNGCKGTGRTPTGKQAHKACDGTGREPGGPILPYPCSYCPDKTVCWKDQGELEMFFGDNGKPKFRVVKARAA